MPAPSATVELELSYPGVGCYLVVVTQLHYYITTHMTTIVQPWNLINIYGVTGDVVCLHLINIADRYPSIC